MTMHGVAPLPVRRVPAWERILVAVDGGSGSRAALRWVADHLEAARGQVLIVCVVPEDASATAEGEAELHAAELVLRTLLEDSEIVARLRRGAAVEQLALAAEEFDADMLVVGTHATAEQPKSGRITVAGRLAARAGCTVVVVPSHWTPGPGPIVAGASIDSASAAALDVACELAERSGRRLMITHVWDPPVVGEIPITPGGSESIPERQRLALDAVVGDIAARASSVDVRADLRHGGVYRELVEAATGADLVVVGRRARSAAAQLILGSTSRALVSAPPCPVAVVPAPRPGIPVTPDTFPEEL